MTRPAPSSYEYKVVPAPSKGVKAKGAKTAEARFALAVEATMNDLAAQGWEYQRTELLPSDERSGLTGSTVNWRNVMVFRRERGASGATFEHSVDTTETAPVSPDAPIPFIAAKGPADVPEGIAAPAAIPMGGPDSAPPLTAQDDRFDDSDDDDYAFDDDDVAADTDDATNRFDQTPMSNDRA